MNAPTTPSLPRMPAGHDFVRELARGGLGVVYLARNRTLNALRAIKRPQSRSDLEPESGLIEQALLVRFRRERLAIGSLEHPHENIIRAYDAGEDDEGPYLIMEYLNGESLAGLLSRRGRLEVPEACELVRQAAIGLGAAHKLGLVHRDVKPSNLMLARTHDGARVVVIDWGLVKRLETDGSPNRSDDLLVDRSLTSAGGAMGTPDYISPDQILDASDVDARADIYSLGVTLYALFAGQAPFQDRKKQQEKFKGHIHEPFPRLVGVRSDVFAIIEKMVEKSPERRFATAEDVAKRLEPFACGPRSQSLLALLAPPGSTITYPPSHQSPFEQATKLGALPLPDSDGPASPPGLVDPRGGAVTYPPRDPSPFEQETKLGALPLPNHGGPASPPGLVDPRGGAVTYPPRDPSPFEQETKLGALPLPNQGGPASPKASPVDEASNVNLPPASVSRPVRGLWISALAAGVLSGFLGWVTDITVFDAARKTDRETAARAMSLGWSFVAELAILAAVLGLAGGIARRSLRAGFRAGIIGAGLVATAMAAAGFSAYLTPKSSSGLDEWRLFLPLGVSLFFTLVALGTPGFSFRLGVGVEGRWFPSALGAIICGIASFAAIALFLYSSRDVPNLVDWKYAMLPAHILWAVFVAVGAALPAVGKKPREATTSSRSADTSSPVLGPRTRLAIWVIAGLVSGLLGWVADNSYVYTGSARPVRLVQNGAILGAVLGFAGGIARRSARAAIRAAIVGVGLIAIEVAAAMNWPDDLFKGPEGALFNVLFIWSFALSVAGVLPGLMLRLGLGGRGRWIRSAMGGLLGACASLVVIGVAEGRVSREISSGATDMRLWRHVIGAAFSPIVEGPLWGHLLIAVCVAVGAGMLAVGSRNPGTSG